MYRNRQAYVREWLLLSAGLLLALTSCAAFVQAASFPGGSQPQPAADDSRRDDYFGREEEEGRNGDYPDLSEEDDSEGSNGYDYPSYLDDDNGLQAAHEKRDELPKSSLQGGSPSLASAAANQAVVGSAPQTMHLSPSDILKMTRNTKLTIIASLCSAVAVFGILVAALIYVKMHNRMPDLSMEKIKEKIMKKRSGSPARGGAQHFEKADAERVEEESEEEDNEEADFTVYECEGPASAEGKMEIRNPMFHSKAPAEP